MKLRDYILSPVTIVMVICGAIVFACAGFLGVWALDAYGQQTDSGVKACKIMAKNAAANKKTHSNAPLSEDVYNKIEKPFKDSQYADIRVAGTNLVTTVYKIDNGHVQINDIPTIMAMTTKIQTQYGALQTACGNHGVTLVDLPLA